LFSSLVIILVVSLSGHAQQINGREAKTGTLFLG